MKSAKHITSAIDQKEYCITNGHFTRHLRDNNMTYKTYYETYVTFVTPLCSCFKPLTFYQKNRSYANSCGDPICVGKIVSDTKKNWSEEQKLKDSNNKKKASQCRTEEQIQTQINKARKTFKQKYGVEWGTQSETQKVKTKKTKLERYGNEYYSGWEKSAATNRSKSFEEQNIINDKRRQTNIEQFGVSCTWLRPESIKKSRKNNGEGKEYILPSGKVIGVRGHEDRALNRLFSLGYNEQDLLIHDKLSDYQLPRFTFKDHRRHTMVYYPDIYIPKENKIIEVKSPWWWDGNGSDKYKYRLENNLRKKAAVLSNGYKYEVWIFDPEFKGIL